MKKILNASKMIYSITHVTIKGFIKLLVSILGVFSLLAVIAVLCLIGYRLMMPINIVQILPAIEVCNGI